MNGVDGVREIPITKQLLEWSSLGTKLRNASSTAFGAARWLKSERWLLAKVPRHEFSVRQSCRVRACGFHAWDETPARTVRGGTPAWSNPDRPSVSGSGDQAFSNCRCTSSSRASLTPSRSLRRTTQYLTTNC